MSMIDDGMMPQHEAGMRAGPPLHTATSHAELCKFVHGPSHVASHDATHCRAATPQNHMGMGM